ncbi:MAG: hypothetical protein ACYCOY_06955 [Metallibacterium sp.]
MRTPACTWQALRPILAVDKSVGEWWRDDAGAGLKARYHGIHHKIAFTNSVLHGIPLKLL